MRILLDTHVWLWFCAGERRLSSRLQTLLEDESNEFWLSPISVWEALLLAQRGRIACAPDPVTWVSQALRGGPFREAQLTTSIAIRSRLLNLAHEDPADRFIVATALEMGLHLASHDQRLQNVPGLTTLV